MRRVVRHSRRSFAFVIAIAAVVISGCGLAPARGSPPPAAAARPCVAVYPTERCQAILTAAAESLGVADDDVSSIDIQPDPTPRPDGIIQTLGGARPIVVGAHVGGTVREVSMCGGIATAPPCLDAPSWGVGSPIGGGYQDVPCAGEPPDGCAKPLSTLQPKAIAGARQLRIERRTIPVAGIVRHEVRLGDATLPNGVLTVAQGGLADPWPDGVRLSSEGIYLQVRSRLGDRPAFTNLYEHGWWPGTEPVDVFLVFEARHVDPGATIEIRDIVVG
jgi:hypothetical protein